MIYRMACDLAANMQARKFPVRIEYGPTRVRYENAPSGLIVIERAPGFRDRVGAPQGSHPNPRAPRVRALMVRATVYARVEVAGAMRGEHEHECDALVDGLVSALYEWAAAARTVVVFDACGYITPADYSGAEVSVGVAYRLEFSVARGVESRDYEGAARLTGAFAHVASPTVLATRDGVTYEQIRPKE